MEQEEIGRPKEGDRLDLEGHSTETVNPMDTWCGEEVKRVPKEGSEEVEEEEESCNGCLRHASERFVWCFCSY